MRLVPSNGGEWRALVLFPFKAFMGLGIVWWLLWKALTGGNRAHGSLAEMTLPIVLGYSLCAAVFFVDAALLFSRRRHGNIALNLLLAGVAAALALALSSFCAR